MLTHFQRETIQIVSDEPFENPHRLINYNNFIQMVIKFSVVSFQHISKKYNVDRRQRETILKEPKKHILAIQSYMHEHPECIMIRVSNHKQIPDNKIDSLGISHSRKIIGDFFECMSKLISLDGRHGESTIKIFFNLREAFMGEQLSLTFLNVQIIFVLLVSLLDSRQLITSSYCLFFRISQTVNI